MNDQRVGLHFGDYASKVNFRFRWLNEAVTEDLSVELLSASNLPISHGSYLKERQLLKYLTAGPRPLVPDRLLLQAYFEHYDPHRQNRIPKWKKLMEHLSKKGHPRLFVELDNIINKEGLDAAKNRVHQINRENISYQIIKDYPEEFEGYLKDEIHS